MLAQIKDENMVDEILSTAKELFARHGLKKTTMEDIANAMGKGKSTLYYYFPGKIEIFEAVVNEEIKNLLRIINQAVNMATTAKDKLKAYATTRISAMQKFRNLSVVLYEDLFNHISEILQLKLKHEEIQINLIKEIIKEGIQSGEFKKIAELNIDLLSYTLVAAFKGIELPLSVSKLIKNFDSGPHLLVDIMVDGIKK